MASYRPSSELRVVRPCSESWDAMVGDSRSRHCISCGRDVLNVAAMTPKQLEAVIAMGQCTGRMPCMRIVQDEEGLLMVAQEVSRPALLTRIAAAISFTVATSAVSAQTGPAPDAKWAVLEGRVVDPTGAPVPAANIELQHDKEVFKTTTDENGVFAVSVRPGDYDVSATKTGFGIAYPGRVHLQHGTLALKKSIQLNVGTIMVGDVVSVPLKTRKAKEKAPKATATPTQP